MTDVVVLDYGSGNLRSAERALARTGASVTVTSDLDAAADADGLVVPGVGAFAACMEGLNGVRGGTVVWNRLRLGRPVLGICVGMQILFETLAHHAGIALHVRVLSGRDPHHVVEAQFKAVARALRAAVSPDERVGGVPSTKGVL